MPREAVKTLLVIAGDNAQRRLVAAIAARAGWRTTIVDQVDDAIDLLNNPIGTSVEALLVDLDLIANPVEFVGNMRTDHGDKAIYVLTALDALSTAVDAMRAGATDYLAKPLAPERLLIALETAANRSAIEGELRPMAEKLWQPLPFEEIVGSAPVFRASIATAAKAARARVTVLIEGEQGSGKEMVAEAIHAASPRARRPLIVVDCSAIPANVIDSDLFGHERGAFAGAFERKPGRLVDADGGTLFLDEVGSLPLETQARLLAALETGRIWPLGARGWREVDVRVIAASRKSLADEVAAGRFREDLLYRLATIHVSIPPLRDRMGDLPALARHLLARIARQPGLRETGITEDALNLLMAYDWPGNIRQLQNALFRSAVLCDAAELTTADFPQIAQESFARRRQPRVVEPILRPPTPAGGVMLYTAEGHIRPLDEIEADIIRLAIGHYRGRMSEVARRLGIGRSTLYRKLGELGIHTAA